MEDQQIIDLYWQRNEDAIGRTEEKYGHYLSKIAYNILSDREDSQESVNDTYLAAWNSMPPHRPSLLPAYLAQLTRRISIDRFRYRTRDKRQGSEYALSLSELDGCISAGDSTQEQVDAKLLADAIAAYLRLQSRQSRTVFLARYYFLDSIRDISASTGLSQGAVKSLLYRTRMGLRDYLRKEGFAL